MKSLTIILACSAILCHAKIAPYITQCPSFIHGRSVRVDGRNDISFFNGDLRTDTSSSPRKPRLRTRSRSPSPSRICMNMDVGGGELSSALATLDREWQMTSRSSNRPTGGSAGWTKLVLRNDDDDNDSEKSEISNEDEKFVYLLEPCATPSSVILFLGGAGLGQFPHIAYSQLLSKISQTLNASIIAAPYAVGLDHFELSKSTGELLRRAVVQCEELGSYSPSLPKFYLAHSLGSKLFSIALAAGGLGTDLNGIGFLAYNNFGFKDTVGMAKSFSREMQGNDDDGNASTDPSFNDFISGGGQNAMFDKVLEFAEQAVSMSGIEFTPSPSDTSRMINMKYGEELQEKTRLFVFDDDDLDSSQDFVQACQNSSFDSNNGIGKLTTSGLPGTHLTPVYLNFALEDLPIPEEARELTGGFAGGFRGASFGDEEKMNTAADEICDWVMGKTPSRQPNWGKRKSDVDEQLWGKRLSAGIIEPEVE